MGVDKGTKPAAKVRGVAWKAKWIALGVLILGVFIAVQAGYAGFGWAHLMSAVYPRDHALLGYVPVDTKVIVIVDPHQLDLKSLGGADGTPRTAIVRVREDVKKATGIDLALDVDKLIVSPSLAVARGRFDGKKLASRLAEHRYVAADHKGVGYLVRAGEDAIAVIDDAVLLYGDDASIKASIDAKQGGTSLAQNEATTDRLKRLGWGHPLLVSVRVTDDKPSLRAMLSGSTGPRAVTVGVSTKTGLDVHAIVDSASPSAAEELRKLLEEKRAGADALNAITGPELGPVLTDVAKKATIALADGGNGVKLHVHLEPAQLELIIKKANGAAPLAAYWKTLRLYQLLVPGN